MVKRQSLGGVPEPSRHCAKRRGSEFTSCARDAWCQRAARGHHRYSFHISSPLLCTEHDSAEPWRRRSQERRAIIIMRRYYWDWEGQERGHGTRQPCSFIGPYAAYSRGKRQPRTQSLPSAAFMAAWPVLNQVDSWCPLSIRTVVGLSFFLPSSGPGVLSSRVVIAGPGPAASARVWSSSPSSVAELSTRRLHGGGTAVLRNGTGGLFPFAFACL
jgi:hypothetical protein